MTEAEMLAAKISICKTYGADEHFLEKTWQNYQVNSSNERAVKIVEHLQLGERPGAYIRGPVGSGKTHLMKCVFNAFVDWKVSLQMENLHSPLKAYWISMSGYLDELRNKKYAAKKKAQEASILFIDDIGASTKTEWVQDEILQLLDFRSERSLQTFTTSNLKMTELEEHYGSRVVSRLHGLCLPVEITGVDQRKEEMKQNFNHVIRQMNGGSAKKD